MRRSIGSSAARALIYVIQLYRHMISPLRPATCRFMPTCSQYAVDALTEYGVVKGGWLAMVRLLKCGPWHRGGWDPIPERRGGSHESCGDADEHRVGPDAADDVPGTRTSRAESETRV
ncbi:membrane protein insertion efficiency factor YidD [Mycolicibacterium moriokaense]|uniref:membrane protein insertion efficiency factor YidD n=1 Tax=Mycolicibacterium moriokaense TaxID=39691 RepID=UPI0009F323DF|nr:membrane protein insertion efficiency factor YidD [Mycolicibacterium moriokaense]ORB23612.1 membrane protein insertion efficiency factor YidD [Mycolicibacterium moriokaense]